MTCHLFSAKPLSKPMLGYYQPDPKEQKFSEILIKIQNFSFMKMHVKILSAKWQPFCPGLSVSTFISPHTHTNTVHSSMTELHWHKQFCDSSHMQSRAAFLPENLRNIKSKNTSSTGILKKKIKKDNFVKWSQTATRLLNPTKLGSFSPQIFPFPLTLFIIHVIFLSEPGLMQ